VCWTVFDSFHAFDAETIIGVLKSEQVFWMNVCLGFDHFALAAK
jgi:hypothetical protein